MTALADLPDLLARLGDQIDTPFDADRGELALEDASDIIRAETGQDFDTATETVTLAGSGRRVIQLPQTPVTAVATVAVDGLAYTLDTNYRWAADGTLTRLGANWPLGPVVVAYTHGYATIPGDIRRLCARFAADLFDDRHKVRSESVGSYSVTYLRSASGNTVVATDDDMRILNRYRQVVAP